MKEKQDQKRNDYGMPLHLDQLDLVKRAFRLLLQNEKDIEWWDDHTLASVEDLKEFALKLDHIKEDRDSRVVVSMNFREWVIFTSYIVYSAKHNPHEEDRNALEDICDLITDMEDQGLVPF